MNLLKLLISQHLQHGHVLRIHKAVWTVMSLYQLICFLHHLIHFGNINFIFNTTVLDISKIEKGQKVDVNKNCCNYKLTFQTEIRSRHHWRLCEHKKNHFRKFALLFELAADLPATKRAFTYGCYTTLVSICTTDIWIIRIVRRDVAKTYFQLTDGHTGLSSLNTILY